MTELLFLGGIGAALCAAYFMLGALFSLFFRNTWPWFTLRASVRSVSIIAVLAAAMFSLSLSIPEPELSNRALHAFGGGFMAVLVFFLAVRDLRLPATRFQFLVLAVLMGTFLGVANEIAEFLLQHYFDRTFAWHIYDTWYDLTSNIIGTSIGVVLLTPFVQQSKYGRNEA